SRYRKISCHKLFNPSWPTACKVKLIVACKVIFSVPGLDNTTSYQVRLDLLVCVRVRLNKTRLRNNIVIEEQHNVVPGLYEPRFKAPGIRGSGKCNHRIAAERCHASRVRATSGTCSLVWSRTMTSAGGGFRARIWRMVSTRTWSRP